MAARYVWLKYSLAETVSIKTGSRAAYADVNIQIARTSSTSCFALCSGLSYDADAETFSPSGTYSIRKISSLDTLQEDDDGDYYANDVVSVSTYPYIIKNANSSTGKGAEAITAASGKWNLWRNSAGQAYVYNSSVSVYNVTASVTYGQGSTGYGYISSDTAGEYGSSTDGAEADGYWYIYQGTDSITPTALSCSTATPMAGDAVTLTVTAASNTYGGTIYYTYEVSTDGGDTWQTISTTTGTEVAYTIPADAETVLFRVTAADNYGFTDSDSVYTAALTVSTNTAPTAPGAPVIAEDPVLGGETITLTWTAAADEDGNLAGYCLERSYNGGSFAQIYQGTALTCTDSITWGWVTVQYRVYAYDDDGAYSDYATGESTEVVNNTAPEAPATLTIPASIYSGISFKLSWSAASDTDDNLAGYTVEVSTDGGTTWTDTGLTPGADDTSAYYAVSDAEQVQMRIQAYDTYAYTSDWTYSGTRTVINNTSPTITVTADDTEISSGGDTGTYTVTAPEIAVAIYDADGDTVTVTVTMGSTVLNGVEISGSGTVTVDFGSWQTITNGTYTLTVTADDGTDTVTWTGTMTKDLSSCSITMTENVTTENTITGVIMSINGSIPDDATVSCLATADGSTWEDVTDYASEASLYTFTAAGKSFNFKLSIERGETTGYVSSVQGVLITEE